jgi:hypothetical protein
MSLNFLAGFAFGAGAVALAVLTPIVVARLAPRRYGAWGGIAPPPPPMFGIGRIESRPTDVFKGGIDRSTSPAWKRDTLPAMKITWFQDGSARVTKSTD